ncbi:MAG TPA: phosphodiester glycosidase family protein [Gaiellaceae bacterium]|nr:phosphodiester glycosidase family protein [Gaiellaceae bacterium]
MLRKILPIALAALVFAAPADAQRVSLMPGVTYEKEVSFTTHGPVVLHVLRAPRPGGLYALKPILSNDLIVGRERVTEMQRRVTGSATVAGVNGDLFSWAEGRPSGMLMLSGALAAQPSPDRSSTGIAVDGSLVVGRVRFAGTWQGTGQRRPLVLNRAPSAGGTALYTPLYGPATPAAADTVELVVQAFPAAAPARDLAGVVTVAKQGGSTPIPPGGAVLVGRGATGAGRLAAEAPLGTNVVVRLTLSPDWSALPDAIGGGPVLVRNSLPIFRANEVFSIEQLVPRHPRTAVGQAADGSIILATADGRRPGYSVGMTNFEMALTMARLGAVTANALDGGGSSTMAFEGSLLNRPSDPGGERAVAESLSVLYYGVHAPQLPLDVISPNGDGVAEQQTLAYKLVRPSTVEAKLIGPDGSEQLLDSGAKTAVGTFRFPWAGPGAEGTWRFVVTATDDLGRVSTADRTFSLNTTLGAVRAATPSITRRGTLRATFALARPAQVRARIVTAGGAFVANIASRELAPGARTLTWRARSLRVGRYEIRVTAQNEFGAVTQSAPFSVRRR